MAIAKMTKVMIAAHRSQAVELLEALQAAGIVELLDAERAMISKEWPELQIEGRRPRDLEETNHRLEKAVAFLGQYSQDKRSIFEPLQPVNRSEYSRAISGAEAIDLLEAAEKTQSEMEKLCNQCENVGGTLEMLKPWKSLQTPVEEIRQLQRASCLVGLVPYQHYKEICEKLSEFGAAIQEVGATGTMHACIIVCLKENAGEVQKILRSGDFESVNFEGMTGTVSELISEYQSRLENARSDWSKAEGRAREMAKQLLTLQILSDHYGNLLHREQTRMTSPATESVILLEGWVKEHDFSKLEQIVGRFDAANVGRIEAGRGEVRPVEIENSGVVRPFESITRLYGMPHPTDADPTVFLAPFFALFFGICLTDAAYGLVMIGIMWWLLKKIKGDAKFIKMMLYCSIVTVVAGALTGGWCADAIQIFVPSLSSFRESIMWFDPFVKPMHFFVLSLVLGYLQIIFGIGVGFWNKFRSGRVQEAIWDHGTWFVWLNSLALFGLGKTGVLPSWTATVAGLVAVVPGIGILLFSEREGGWGARVGMGCYNLFSTVFYVGDVLSYIRLMALGMVTGGFGMAINVISKQVGEMPYVGWLLGGLIFVGGHLFNIANSMLSAFVHSMRLQFVEFFTKFVIGGGKDFEPLRKQYNHIQVEE
ncbi:MAG: V-type ATP synthase subunit I [Sedimentisphaerales bacterium]|nr:V-type ATP synthase subunit I [Sedimentisphaerales bacterium]